MRPVFRPPPLRVAPAALLLLSLLPLLLVAVASGCAHVGARPWQRDQLARREMQVDPDPVETSVDDHIYFSKEASSGGRTFAGGGCGCN
ncbi:MAG: DUF4266 domain-containing protein [Candidatus Eisenbacteria bacterium]|nr:DUF4266 domain-containing protein [Candidatus Eisenbacteria bacterium]